MNSSFRFMSCMIWLHFVCFVIKDTSCASHRHLKGDKNNKINKSNNKSNNNKNNKNNQTTNKEITTPCPCFTQEKFNNGVNKVINFSHDYYTGACTEEHKVRYDNSNVTINQLSLRTLDTDTGTRKDGYEEKDGVVVVHAMQMYHTIHFSVQVDMDMQADTDTDTDIYEDEDEGPKHGNNECGQSDMMFLINQDEAKACLSIMNTGCQIMKEKICPCFNFEKLQQPTIGIDPVRTCRLYGGGGSRRRLHRHSEKENLGIHLMNSKKNSLPLYGIEKSKNGNRKCIGSGSKIEKNLNKDQYEHCTKLLEQTCTKDFGLDQFSCADESRFKFRQQTKDWCKWVGKNRKSKTKERRCQLRNGFMATMCPITCNGRCPSE